jgi:hypothetical protein
MSTSPSSPILEDWKSKNPRLVPHLTFLPVDSPSRRSIVNSRAVDNLQNFSSYLADAIADIQQSISSLAIEDVLNLGPVEYDDKSALFLSRQIAVLKHKIQKREIRKLTVQFAVLTDLADRTHSALELFCSECLPPEFGCQVASTFFEVAYGDVVARDMHFLSYAAPHLRHMEIELLQKRPALSAADFPTFLRQLAVQAQSHELPSEGYFAPFDGEISLSRALFCSSSPFLVNVDQFVDRLAETGGAVFHEGSISLIGVSADSDSKFRSVVLLMYFRCVFDRVYERHSHLFAPVFDRRFEKLEELAQMPADFFVLPRDLFSVDLKSVSIAELFRGQQFYRAAAQFFEAATFSVNPIDALYLVNKAMVGVRKAALIIRMGNASASVADINRALPFDDLFALLFGALLASGPPVVDVFHLASLVQRFSPKQALSPLLAFAKANLEALCAHIDRLDMAEMRAKMAG